MAGSRNQVVVLCDDEAIPEGKPRLLRSLRSLAMTLLLMQLFLASAHAVVTDSYIESFDSRQDDSTINGIDSWNVTQGVVTNAVTQNTTTFSGDSKALQVKGAETTVNVSRIADYGDAPMAWIELVLKPGMGTERASSLITGIGGITFDYTGKVFAMDGSSWVDTGFSFSAGTWYRVIMKLDFDTHLYDIYLAPAAEFKIPFVPDQENLSFMNNTLSSISEIGFEGVFNSDASQEDDTFVDEMIVHFIDRLEFITAAQKIVKGEVSDSITVQLQNKNAQSQTSVWADLNLELKSSSETGEFSMDPDDWVSIEQAIIPENAQQVTFYYKDSAKGKPIFSAKETPDRGWLTGLQEMEIIAQGEAFTISATSPQIAGETFTVTITAKDAVGDTATTYSGEIDLLVQYVSPGVGTYEIVPSTASGFEEGVLALDLTYADAGTIEIKVCDREDTLLCGTSMGLEFVPASFQVSLETSQIVSEPFGLTVSALSADGFPTPNYVGPATLQPIGISPEETSGGSVAPSSLASEQFQEGSVNLQATYDRWGTIQIEAADTAYPDQKGLSDSITFDPSEFVIEVESPPSERDFFYTGEVFEIILSVLDANQDPILNFQEDADLVTDALVLGLPLLYLFTLEDQGKRVFSTSVSAAGTYLLHAELPSGLTADSDSIEIQEAFIVVISTAAPIGTTEVEIVLVDSEGNTITTESTLAVQVILEEENPDGSAFSSAVNNPVSFLNGVAKVVVGNSQAEVVTVSASTSLGFKTRKGTVEFGKVSKKGLITQLLRRLKE